MKTFLFDFTNYGIIHVNDDTVSPKRWHFCLLRSCILDTNISRVSPRNPSYKNLDNQSIQSTFFHLDRNMGISIGSTHEFNEIFLEKQRLARLMMPVIDRLTMSIKARSFNMLDDFGLPIDDTIAIEISQCDVSENIYSPGVIEYARTLEITNEQAYQELTMEYKTHHAIKMRSYAQVQKYLPKIRSIRSEEDAEALLLEINNKLFNDTFI